jgi:hypothetical protein
MMVVFEFLLLMVLSLEKCHQMDYLFVLGFDYMVVPPKAKVHFARKH